MFSGWRFVLGAEEVNPEGITVPMPRFVSRFFARAFAVPYTSAPGTGPGKLEQSYTGDMRNHRYRSEDVGFERIFDQLVLVFGCFGWVWIWDVL